LQADELNSTSGTGSRQWKAKKLFPVLHMEAELIKSSLINQWEKNSLICSVLVPLLDSNLSTLFPFKEFEINLMIAFK